MGLQTFCKSLHNTHIRLLIDNTTAIAVLNHMGTSHSKPCKRLGKEIWEWCIIRNIWKSAAHIPGVHNITADLESRKTNSSTEWMIDSNVLHETISKINFRPDIDLFASRLNNQFPRYVAFRPDPGAVAIDALTLNLSQFQFYAFPPFGVIATFLQKIMEDGVTGICVIPDWPTQAWYPKAMQMCVTAPLKLGPGKTLLKLPGHPKELHPLRKSLVLLVYHLSGSNSIP